MNISGEAVEDLAHILAQEGLVEADMAGSGWNAETDSSDHFMPWARDKARQYLAAAAPHLMESAFVRGYRSALADRGPVIQGRSRRAPRWARKHRSAGHF